MRGGTAEESSFRFEYEIAPILARHGCAAADCHGGATGRANFKLSLFATDPRSDYRAIVDDLNGRRVDFQEPGQSLLLLKPTRALKHEGGKIFAPESDAAERLREWIGAGAPWQTGEYYHLNELVLELKNGSVAHVWAHFEGLNSPRDVLSMARFTSTNPAVASVDEHGQITQRQPGDTWIIASYAGLSSRAALRKPFGQPAVWHEPHPLDAAWATELGGLGIRPGPQADARILARRLYLDLAGRVPSPDEVAAFAALPMESRVEETANQLLADHQGFVAAILPTLREWFDIRLDSPDDNAPSQQRMRQLNRLLADWVRTNEPFTALAEQFTHQRTPFLQRFEDPRDRAEYTSKTLLGLSIDCARCHNHPLDRWRQDQHLRFSAWFAEPRPDPARPGELMAGKFFLPGDQKAITPELLPIGHDVPRPTATTPEDTLALWLLEGTGGQLARHVANRIFGWLAGRHLVNPPEDHRATNPAVFESMLATLASHLEASQFDVRALIRFIVTSKVYQLASEADAAHPVDYFARREARPLTDAQFKQSVAWVLGLPVPNWQLPESPLSQQLALLNSDRLHTMLAAPGNEVEAIAVFEPEPERQIEALFRRILSRPPRAEETAALLPALAEATQVDEALRDLAFALISSREFGSQR